MLTDERRNICYRQALQNMVQPGMQVLDIGTGTGLLAMMAARTLKGKEEQLQQSRTKMSGDTHLADAPAGSDMTASPAQSKHEASLDGAASNTFSPSSPSVLACEVFPPMAALATRLIAINKLDPWVRVVLKRSDELTVAEPSSSNMNASGFNDSAPSQSHSSSTVMPPPPEILTRRQQLIAERLSRKQQQGMTPGPAMDPSPDRLRMDHSQPAAELKGKVDVIVTEIFDSELLGEGLLSTLRHALEHLLKVGESCNLQGYGLCSSVVGLALTACVFLHSL